ncbi:laccase domain-containing protein, partial [Faecalibaculum rodentium]
AWFSPSILQDSLEVGPEVIEAMEPLKELGLDVDAFWSRSEDPDSDRLYLDNQGLNVAMLRMAGLPAENIHVSELDTKTHPDCFSYRNEGRKTGEHFTFGWIESSDPGTGAS